MTKTRTGLTLKEAAERFLKRHSDNAVDAVVALLSDNKRYRDRIHTMEKDGPYRQSEADAELRRENERLESELERLTDRVAPEGAIVLTGDDAKAYTAFKALNLKPEDVAGAVKERDTLKGTLAQRDAEKAWGEVAQALGFNAKVLTEQFLRPGAEYALEMREVSVQANGKTEKKQVAHVRKAGDEKAPFEPLTEVVKRDFAAYLPALTAKPDGSSGAPGNTSTTTAVPFPIQTDTGTAAPSDAVADFAKRSQEQRDNRPNPLFPATPKAATT